MSGLRSFQAHAHAISTRAKRVMATDIHHVPRRPTRQPDPFKKRHNAAEQHCSALRHTSAPPEFGRVWLVSC